MFSLKKKENQLLLLIFSFFIFFIFYPEIFWEITNTPFVKLDDNFKIYEKMAIVSNDFYDLRYLQYISGYFDSILLPSDKLYNAYKIHDHKMVINYPRIWIAIGHFINIKSDTVMYTVYFTVFLFYINIFYYFTKITNSYFFCYLFFCGANLLLLERGNVDIIIIVLLFYTLLSKNKFLNYIGYLLSSLLKFYPAFSLLFFLNNKRSISTIFFLSIIFITYLFFVREDIQNISLVNPVNGHSSYGFLSIIINIKNYFNIDLNYILFVVANLLIVLMMYYFLFKEKLAKINFQHSNIFLIGGGIFIFTFMINSHHDYRMMFLIFCVPLALMLKNNNFKFFYLIIIILALELQRLLFVFDFLGGSINTLSKLILFYITSIIYLNIIEKKMINIFNLKKKSANEYIS